MGLVVMISSVSRKSSGLGLTSITNPSSFSIRRVEMVEGSNMMCAADCLLRSSLIGKTLSTILLHVIYLSQVYSSGSVPIFVTERMGSRSLINISSPVFIRLAVVTNKRLSNTFWEVNCFWRSAVSFMFFLLVFIFPPVGLLRYLHITILSRWIRRGNRRWAGSQEKQDSRAKESHQE